MQVWKSVTANTSQCFSLSPLSPLFQLGTPLPTVTVVLYIRIVLK